MAALSLGILGFILIIALPREMKVGRLIGFYLTLSVACPFVALLSLISSNIAGYTKKTTVAALYLVAYCVGNIIGKVALPISLNSDILMNHVKDRRHSAQRTHQIIAQL